MRNPCTQRVLRERGPVTQCYSYIEKKKKSGKHGTGMDQKPEVASTRVRKHDIMASFVLMW